MKNEEGDGAKMSEGKNGMAGLKVMMNSTVTPRYYGSKKNGNPPVTSKNLNLLMPCYLFHSPRRDEIGGVQLYFVQIMV